MPAAPKMHIYVLNVGQADTNVIRTPGGKVIVIDAADPQKLRHVLGKCGVSAGGEIELLVITHPHGDHCSAANVLLEEYEVGTVMLPPFWYDCAWEENTYRDLFNHVAQSVAESNVSAQFVAGYTRIYPDEVVPDASQHGQPLGTCPCLELLGPPNDILEELVEGAVCEANHLSIMARMTWNKFSMVFAGDAQMENWNGFDRAGMLQRSCSVLKTSHHGSKNGTLWERIMRLEPGKVIVSSDPDGHDRIPDEVGCAVFREYQEKDHLVVMTSHAGTIEIRSTGSQSPTAYAYLDDRTNQSPLDNPSPRRLLNTTQLPDWDSLLRSKLDPGE